MSEVNFWSLFAQGFSPQVYLVPEADDDVEECFKQGAHLFEYHLRTLQDYREAAQRSLWDREQDDAMEPLKVLMIYRMTLQEKKHIEEYLKTLTSLLNPLIIFIDQPLNKISSLKPYITLMPFRPLTLTLWQDISAVLSQKKDYSAPRGVNFLPNSQPKVLASWLKHHALGLNENYESDKEVLEGSCWNKLEQLLRHPSMLNQITLEDLQHLVFALDVVELQAALGQHAAQKIPYSTQKLLRLGAGIESLYFYEKYLQALSMAQLPLAQEALRLWIGLRSSCAP